MGLYDKLGSTKHHAAYVVETSRREIEALKEQRDTANSQQTQTGFQGVHVLLMEINVILLPETFSTVSIIL